MPFALSAHALDCIHNYDAAKRFWDRAKPFTHRGKPITHWNYEGKRQLKNNRSDHLWIRKTETESFELGYHATALVTYHPDQSFTLVPWTSQSSNAFVHRMTPPGVQVQYTHTMGTLVELHGLVWYSDTRDWKEYMASGLVLRIGQNVTIWQDAPRKWRWAGDLETFEDIKIDQPAARAALKASRYHDFVAYYHARSKMVRIVDQPFIYSCLPRERVTLLAAGPEESGTSDGGWNTLTAWVRRDPKTRLEKVRLAVYAAAGALTVTQREVLPLNELNSVTLRYRKYSRYDI